jgi:hypothetical protein
MLQIWQLIRGMDPAGLLFISVIGYVLDRRQRAFAEELAAVKAALDLLLETHHMRGNGNSTSHIIRSAG